MLFGDRARGPLSARETPLAPPSESDPATARLGLPALLAAALSLIALLIAEAKCRNDSKIAVLSANKILARQMYRLL